MKYIIMINGKYGSGKDYACEVILKHYGGERVAFADPIKNILCDTFNTDLDTLNEYKNKKLILYIKKAQWLFKRYLRFIDFRQIPQNFGQAMKKEFGEKIWADKALVKIKHSNKDVIVVSDFRYLVEYNTIYYALHNYGYRIVSVRILTDALHNDKHDSENELNDFNFEYEVYNDKTSKFDIKILNMMQDIKGN